ncbi:Lrp/AsnC family transcriptional regulator [Nocardia sp. NPDC004711]
MVLKKAELEMLRAMVEAPRLGVREWARRLGIARGTAQARINRLEEAGAIKSYRPVLSPEAIGVPVLAYVRVNVTQDLLEDTLAELERIPYLIEVNSVAGDADLVCRLFARDLEHLEDLLRKIVQVKGVRQTRSEIVLRRRFGARVGPLLDSIIAGAE